MKGSRVNFDLAVITGSIALSSGLLVLAVELRKSIDLGRVLEPGSAALPPLLLLVMSVLWFSIFMALGVPRVVRQGRPLNIIFTVSGAIVVASFAFAGLLYLMYRELPRLIFVYFSLLDVVVLLAFSLLMRSFAQRYFSHEATARVLIAGAGASGFRLAEALERRQEHPTQVLGFLDTQPAEDARWPVLGNFERARDLVRDLQISDVIVALPLEQHAAAVRLVSQLQSTPVHIRMLPNVVDFAMLTASVEYIEGMPLLGLRVPALSDEARLWKRLFDVCISIALLLMLCLPMLLIALLIRLDSPGPILYRTRRVGENGRLFWMLKFRSMVQDADQRFHEVLQRDEHGVLRFKTPDDPRITRIGAWLRKTSLDELPQLWNVLRGEMSLVGPRPELPAIVEQEYEPWQWSRFTVPQGMTGWWQINRRGYEHQHLCTADDLYYIQNYSLMLDIKILLRTFFVVLQGEGAY